MGATFSVLPGGVFMAAAVEDRLDVDAGAHVKGADAFGGVELVAGDGEQVRHPGR
jgi:hypothetical protein